jgi:hypothetical protein
MDHLNKETAIKHLSMKAGMHARLNKAIDAMYAELGASPKDVIKTLRWMASKISDEINRANVAEMKSNNTHKGESL